MRFSGSRGHAKFDLDGGQPRGPATIIRAAVDPVRLPEDPALVAVIERCLCKVTIGEDGWIVTGMTGETEFISYNDPITKWSEVCQRLLDKAMEIEK